MGLAVPSLWILVLLGSQVRWKIAAWRASRAKKGTHKWSGELGSQTLCGKVIAVDGGAAEAFVLAVDQRATEYESSCSHGAPDRPETGR